MTALAPVYIDSCAWNYLFDRKVNLAEELPASAYQLCITREVEIELQPLRANESKSDLVDFVDSAILANDVQTTSTFGFASVQADGSLSEVQVFGGFDVGTWRSDEDRLWLSQEEVLRMLPKSVDRKKPLGKNQADASMAVRAFDAVVLTAESRTKKGPMQLAWSQGGHVVFLTDVEASGITLHEFILGRKTFSSPPKS